MSIDSKSDKTDIGFLEPKDSWLLHPKYFPSKVGGKPSWLDLKDLPNPKDLLCKKCEVPMIFLCQIYAPYEELDECFHRTIFIFICRNGTCCSRNTADNLVVLRCQLKRKNDFYSFEPCPEIENEEFPMDKWPNLCNVCGMKAPSHCSKCKKVYYCCRQHQVTDWHGEHKEICANLKDMEKYEANNFSVTNTGKTLLFEEWELIVDDEDEEEASSNIDLNAEMEKMKKIVQEKKASLNSVSENELEQYATQAPKDKVYNKFSKRIARHPDQVLRYQRGGEPLYITDASEDMKTVPYCQYCGGERQFEFQVMPQLLNYINVGHNFTGIDWGILAVYTCKKSCTEGPAYKQEVVIKQDLTN